MILPDEELSPKKYLEERVLDLHVLQPTETTGQSCLLILVAFLGVQGLSEILALLSAKGRALLSVPQHKKHEDLSQQ